jgi:hypothetical protein
MKRILTVVVLVGLIALNLGIRLSYAGEIDILLQKLVDKGVLTPGEAQQIGTETKEQVKKEIAEGKYSSLPQWVQQTKLKGDFRLRYEWDKNKGAQDNSRARIRTRLGLESKINNKLKMGVGIATGSQSDPRSRNITLGNDPNASNTPDSAKSIVLDYAYGAYTPFNGLTLTGGKFLTPIWYPIDVFWKGDITPEGAGVNFNHKFGSKLEVYLNELVNIMKNDSRTDKQAVMIVTQPGFNFAVNDKISLKSALAVNNFINVQGTTKYSYSSGTNSFNANNQYKYNYNSLQPSMELSFTEPFHGLVPYGAIFGEYMYNIAAPTYATGKGGFDVGLKFGNDKVDDWKKWQAKIIYSKLGRDSWLDIFTDSDRYSGKTNSRSLEAIFDFGLGKNTWLTLDYYTAESLSKTSASGYAPAQVLQVDWNMKF